VHARREGWSWSSFIVGGKRKITSTSTGKKTERRGRKKENDFINKTLLHTIESANIILLKNINEALQRKADKTRVKVARAI